MVHLFGAPMRWIYPWIVAWEVEIFQEIDDKIFWMPRSIPHPANLPPGLQPYFQEYDVTALDLQRDANLIIQRTLEFGTWDEVRWVFETLGARRVRLFYGNLVNAG
jgi:hypothetical protein